MSGSRDDLRVRTGCGPLQPKCRLGLESLILWRVGVHMESTSTPVPLTESPTSKGNTRYSGFWIRLTAFLVDMVIFVAVSLVLTVITGLYVYVWWLALILYYSLFNGIRGQTPGKMPFGIYVSITSGEAPGVGRALVRFFGQVGAFLTLFVGFVWIGLDKQKQGWHDHLAGTYVVKR